VLGVALLEACDLPRGPGGGGQKPRLDEQRRKRAAMLLSATPRARRCAAGSIRKITLTRGGRGRHALYGRLFALTTRATTSLTKNSDEGPGR